MYRHAHTVRLTFRVLRFAAAPFRVEVQPRAAGPLKERKCEISRGEYKPGKGALCV